MTTDEFSEDAVAIVGLSGRFAGAPDLESFWRLLLDGGTGRVVYGPEEPAVPGRPSTGHEAPDHVPVGYPLAEPCRFDSAFFGLSPAEAASMDPQHRLVLECAWEALERSGRPPAARGSTHVRGPAGPVGVFLTSSTGTYAEQRIPAAVPGEGSSNELKRAIGNDPGALALRVSYLLDLTGPSLSVHTACSSALVAVHLAVQSLLARECSTAIAGGASVRQFDAEGYRFEEGSILAPDGVCRPFDAAAAGTVPGDGVGVVVLRRLADACRDGDPVAAVILGSAVTNDGARKVGFTAPSPTGQAGAVLEALAVADAEPASIDYVELHGTGTALGDPVEAQSLTATFGVDQRPAPLLLGSVKANVGHLDAAAGFAGLIKTVLALWHGVVPATPTFTTPHPDLELDPDRFRVVTTATPWPDQAGRPRRAGVSAFGVGGTNAHVVLQAAPRVTASPRPAAKAHVLPVSARSVAAARRTATRLADHLAVAADNDLHAVAGTLQERRQVFPVRAAVAARSAAEAVEALRRLTVPSASVGRPRVVLAFPGQGSQFEGMGATLYEAEPAFRSAMDECATAFGSHLDRDVRDLACTASAEVLHRTGNAQPALFAVEYSMAALLRSWGVQPEMMIGHSIGELVAACLAGVFTLEAAAVVVAARARLMQAAPPGRMLAVQLSAAEAVLAAGGLGELAADNGPRLSVLAGSEAEMAAAQERLEASGVGVRPLATSHAFHTTMMESAVPGLEQTVAALEVRAPTMPFVSGLTGRLVTVDEATSPAYWARQLREPVRFGPGLARLTEWAGDDPLVLIEAGPGTALATLTRAAAVEQQDGRRDVVVAPLPRVSRAGCDATSNLAAAAAAIWSAGVDLDWEAVRGYGEVRVAMLPGHAFDGEIHELPRLDRARTTSSATGRILEPARWTWTPSWRRRAPVAVGEGEQRPQVCVVLDDHAGLAADVVAELRRCGHEAVLLPADCERGELRDLVRELAATGRRPRRLLHAGLVTAGTELSYPAAHQRGYLALVRAVTAFEEAGDATGLRVVVLTDDLEDVAGEIPTSPVRATVHGAALVLPQEISGVQVRCVDVHVPAEGDARDRLVRQLTSEVLDEEPRAGRSAAVRLAYRNDLRWERGLAPVELPAAPGWRRGGAYLVTGSGPWADQAAADITGGGGRVRVVPTSSLADPDAARRAVAAAVDDLGAIDGVLHVAAERVTNLLAAGIHAEPGGVLDAHIRGVLALHSALGSVEGARGAFLAFGSSTAPLVGGFGQAENCGVATFLDAFAAAARDRRVVALDVGQWEWDDWLEQQVASLPDVRADYEQERRAFGVPAAAGFERVRAGISSGLPVVVISTRDVRSVVDEQAAVTTASFTSALTSSAAPDGRDHDGWDPARIWPDDEMAQHIAVVWRDLLGVRVADPDTDFYAIGGNSLFAIQIGARLRAAYGQFPLSTVFEAPTVPKLAEAIRLHQAAAVEAAEMERLLQEIESLTPAQIQERLSRDDA